MGIPWEEAVEIIKPYVVKIITPRGSGTGFLLAHNKDRTACAIATANHVVEASHLWEEPIRILHYSSGKVKLLRAANRAIVYDKNLDTAVILYFPKEEGDELPFPKKSLLLIPKGKYPQVGVELGWVGFPVMSPHNLCFFTGKNSFWSEKHKTYLIDGVVINGVSGGPAFCATGKGIVIVGSVSAYLPNRTDATPGLAMISHVEQYLAVIKTIKDLDDLQKDQALKLEGSINAKPETDGKLSEEPPKTKEPNSSSTVAKQ